MTVASPLFVTLCLLSWNTSSQRLARLPRLSSPLLAGAGC
jgi:hypothetical protein